MRKTLQKALLYGTGVELCPRYSFDDLVAMGKYDFVAPEVVPQNFPLPEKREAASKRIVLFDCSCFGEEVTTLQVLAYGAHQGLVAASAEEVLTLGCSYPLLQKCNSDPKNRKDHGVLVGLGSKSYFNKEHHVLVLAGSGIGRSLTTRVYDDPQRQWLTRRYRFLFVVQS